MNLIIQCFCHTHIKKAFVGSKKEITMAQLAIKGHEKRGAEVIALLEMLGGENTLELGGIFCNSYYIIYDDGEIVADLVDRCNREQYSLYSLEEFEEKFPYKVGDKVYCFYDGPLTVAHVRNMVWDENRGEVLYQIYSDWYSVKDLQPYKVKFMEETKEDWCVYGKLDFEQEPCADKVELVLGDNYEIKVVDGKTYVVRKKTQYPKTYDECCEVLGHKEITISGYVLGYKGSLLSSLQKLLICRDAYWKIYGGSMGLGKPWKPADSKNHVYYFFYCVSNDKIRLSAGNLYSNEVFAFPTQEMRDAFFENFKDLIEECKELL